MCNASAIKKLQNVTIKIDRTTQRQMIDLANRIKDTFPFQHWDEIVVCLSDTLGHYANTKSIAPVNGLLNAEITHALTHRGEQLSNDDKRYSLRALHKATGIGYKVLYNWTVKGWLLPSCRLPKTFRYTMEDFKKAEAKSFEGKSKFPKSSYTDKKTNAIIDFNKAIGV